MNECAVGKILQMIYYAINGIQIVSLFFGEWIAGYLADLNMIYVL